MRRYAAFDHGDRFDLMAQPKAVFEVDAAGNKIGEAIETYHGLNRHGADNLAAELNRREKEYQCKREVNLHHSGPLSVDRNEAGTHVAFVISLTLPPGILDEMMDEAVKSARINR